jgi:hypothetical protein
MKDVLLEHLLQDTKDSFSYPPPKLVEAFLTDPRRNRNLSLFSPTEILDRLFRVFVFPFLKEFAAFEAALLRGILVHSLVTLLRGPRLSSSTMSLE